MKTFVILVATVLNGEFDNSYTHIKIQNNERVTLSFPSLEKCEDKLVEYYVTDDRPFPIFPSWEADLKKKEDAIILSYANSQIKVFYSCGALYLPNK